MPFKKLLPTFALLSALSFQSFLKAEEISLPSISTPQYLEEGTQRELSPKQIEELLPWARDSKMFLVDLLDNTQGLPHSQKIERLIEGIKNVVGESSPKNSELFMRYVLNRALVLHTLLTKEMGPSEVGSTDVQVRVLHLSIQMALKYYDTDMAKLQNNKNPSPYLTFGKDYFAFLNELNKSIFDASAQYSIARVALEWLQWDLYRDLNNKAFAAQIVKINNALKTFPASKMSDGQALNFIRQMRKINQQLNLEKLKMAPTFQQKVAEEERKDEKQEKDEDEKGKKNIAVGETVWAYQQGDRESLSEAQVLALDPKGNYVLKFINSGKSFGGYSRDSLGIKRGCHSLCVGERVLNYYQGRGRDAVITGIEEKGTYILTFYESQLTGGGWATEDLYVRKGCSKKSPSLCVKAKVFNVSNNENAEVLGISSEDKIALLYENGQMGFGWDVDDLAILK